jgi:hypothetical protein
LSGLELSRGGRGCGGQGEEDGEEGLHFWKLGIVGLVLVGDRCFGSVAWYVCLEVMRCLLMIVRAFRGTNWVLIYMADELVILG